MNRFAILNQQLYSHVSIANIALLQEVQQITLGIIRFSMILIILATILTISYLISHSFSLVENAILEKLLRKITQGIRQSLELQNIFDTACKEIFSVLQVDRVGIFKFNPNFGFKKGKFVAESVLPEFPSLLNITIHDHCFGKDYASLYANGKFMIADNIHQNDLTPCHLNMFDEFQVRACIVMPLIGANNELWGLLCVHQCATTRHWKQTEIDFLYQLVNQIEIAIAKAFLYNKLNKELLQRQKAQREIIERNQQLIMTNKKLADATRLKDEFLANMSHELRTPLNAILGMTEGLQDKVFGDLNDKQIKALKTIERSGTHLLDVINDILDLAKIESGNIKINCKPIAVEPLCKSSLIFIKQQALKKRIKLEMKLPLNMPEFFVDELRIRKVLINLLSNAVKFTPEKGHIILQVSTNNICDNNYKEISWINEDQTEVRQKFDFSCPEEEQKIKQYIHIAVIDTGIGIAPDKINKLFEPFVQIDSALNRQYEGTGLGLSLVKEIIRLHGGKIELISKLGAGSCFIIGLPSIPSESKSDYFNQTDCFEHTTEIIQPQMPSSFLILLAEDNKTNIISITSYLKAKGYQVIVATNGIEAITFAESHKPNLILMDIQMPRMDGLEAMRKIRSIQGLTEIPIIAVTALAMSGDRQKILDAGANDYISKPVTMKELTSVIQKFTQF